MVYQMLLRLLLSACGLGLADYLLEGVNFTQYSTLFWAALLLGIANTIVRPLLIVLTLPITFLTLGFFLLVINIVYAFFETFGIGGWWADFEQGNAALLLLERHRHRRAHEAAADNQGVVNHNIGLIPNLKSNLMRCSPCRALCAACGEPFCYLVC